MAAIKLYIREKDQYIIEKLQDALTSKRKSTSEFFIESAMGYLGMETTEAKIRRLEKRIKELEKTANGSK